MMKLCNSSCATNILEVPQGRTWGQQETMKGETEHKPEYLDNMVECETCFQWFHYRCVGIADERDTVLWSCQECRRRLRLNR